MNRLTKKEKGFAKDYLDTGNGTQSALKNYDTDNENVAGSIASQNLRKLKIREYIDSHAEKAESMIYKLSQEADGEAIRLNASKDIMDRAGFKPIDQTMNLNVNIKSIDPKDKEIKELRNKYEEELKQKLNEQSK